MKWADRVTAFVLFIIAGGWIYLATKIETPAFAMVSKLSPGDYPMGVGILLAALAVILFIKTFKVQDHKERNGLQDEGARNTKAVKHLLTGFALFLAYVISVPFFGFVVASPLFVFFFIWFIGRYSLLLTIPIAMGIPATLWIIFAWWLSVPIPKGPWGF